MDNVKDYILLPSDGCELVMSYFDKEVNQALYEDYQRYQNAYQTMSDGNRVKDMEISQLSLTECGHRCTELSKAIYRAALENLITKACDEQKAICERRFWISPSGEEGDWINSSTTPCLYAKDQYERLYGWWGSLPNDVILTMPVKFPGFFGEIDKTETLEDYAFREFNVSSDELDESDMVFYYSCQWDNIPVVDKERIYKVHNSTE